MSLLKETMINPVEKSLISISSGTSSTNKIKDSLGKAYSKGKKAMGHLINCCLITFEKNIYDPIWKLTLDTFSNMTKRVTIKQEEEMFSFHCRVRYLMKSGLDFTIQSFRFE